MSAKVLEHFQWHNRYRQGLGELLSAPKLLRPSMGYSEVFKRQVFFALFGMKIKTGALLLLNSQGPRVSVTPLSTSYDL